MASTTAVTAPPVQEAEPDAYADSSSDDASPDNATIRSGDDNDPLPAARGRAMGATQKRRRVTRACDECRRKKIKCDGKQPCTHCTVYSYDCTYDQPSNRRRNPAPQVVEALEGRLRRAEALLRVLVPDIDMEDPSIDALIAQGPSAESGLPPSRIATTKRPKDGGSSGAKPAQPAQPTQDDQAGALNDSTLESMVSATGQLDLDERGHWDYHGHSSGLSFLRRMGEQFGDKLGPEKLLVRSTPFVRKHPPPEAIDSPRSFKSSADSPQRSTFSGFGTAELPSRAKALELCSDALDDAGAILRIVHQPTFYKRFERIYDLRHEDYDNDDHKFLPLLYSVVALGCLFGKDGQDVDRRGYQSLTDEGYEYFWSARQLMDITDCRDLISLQAVVFMILFLQCSAKLSTCYAYIGVALRSAIRMGLHRAFRDNFTPIEAETRKRTFWAIRKMDTYVGAMLGLPVTLSDDDVDQDLPLEVDDEFITETQILPMPEGRVSLVAAANGNFRLAKIVAKIMRDIYPIKGLHSAEKSPSQVYRISYCKVRELENELQAWTESLPPIFRPGATAEPHILRLVTSEHEYLPPADLTSIRNLLRMAYAHAQMMLYRPFLHYVSSRASPTAVDQRSYACSAACISVSRNIIHITTEMKKSDQLVGSYWFTMYTTFFAILTLVFYALENEGNPTTEHVLRDAREGRDTLAGLAKRSMAADRCTITLTFMFTRLEELMSKSESVAKEKKQTSKKRDAPSTTINKAARSHPDVSQVGVSDTPKRASSFPSNSVPMPVPSIRHTNIAPRPNFALMQGNPSANPSASYFTPTMTPEPQAAGFSPHMANASAYGGPQPFLPTQQSQQQVNNPHEIYPGSMSDLNAIMFPSTDPFVYPNPPMLTLEQNYGQSEPRNPFTTGHDQFLPASTANAGPVSTDDHVDVQLFGPMSGYMATTNPAEPSTSPQFPPFHVPQPLGEQRPDLSRQESWNRQMDEMFRASEWQGRYV